MSDNDLELLARYTSEKAEAAFAELVRRHLDLVHSAALRQVRSPQFAEEVAQSTFLSLARDANRLTPDTILAAWLYRVAHRTAANVVRREARRQLREQIATEVNAMNATAADWTHIEPLLDEAMHALDDTDRAAVLLRYFENKSLREVGHPSSCEKALAERKATYTDCTTGGVYRAMKRFVRSGSLGLRAILVLVFGCVTFPFLAFAQGIPATLLQEDFRIMRSALEQAHGGIYRYTSKREMDRTFDQAYRRIDHSMTELEFWRLAAPVVAHIKCGHTSIWFPARQFETNMLFFPLEGRVLGKRAYVYQDNASPRSALEGAEILSINGRSMKGILEQVRSVITGDGNSSTAKDYRIGHNGGGLQIYLYGLGIRSPFRVTYRDSAGKRQSVELAGLTIPEIMKAWDARNPTPDTNADLKFLDDGKIAVLTIWHWYEYADPKRKITSLDFLKRSFAEIQEKGSTNLIIDVRDNDGGLDALGKQAFSFLWDQPFYYYNDLVLNAREFEHFKYMPNAKPLPADRFELQADGKWHHVKHPNWGLQQPSQPHFAGRVLVLMNGGSFSATCEFLSMLHFHKRATFIGEEPAGGYYGNTSGRTDQITLPNSKLQLGVGLITYYQAVSGYKYNDRGVLPDYPVSYTISELIAGKDKEMELALSLARKPASR